MKKLVIPVVVVVVAAALIVVGMTFFRHRDDIDYRLVEVTRADVRTTVTSTGTLQAITTVQVGTQVSGEVSEIYVDFNDHVTKGQLIARIDPVLLEQAVRSAQADLARNQAELDQDQREFDRIARLYERKAATESEYNTAQYRVDVAKASLESAGIGLERARRNLGYSEIRSPVDGVVLDRTVDKGQTVAASLSAPQLFLIAEDLSKMEILASVDESDIGKIKEGQAVEFTVQAYPDSTFPGTVNQVRLKSTNQENVVNYVVSITVANPTGRLLPGMTATVEFIVAEAKNVLRVPNAALRFRATDEMLAELRQRRQTADADSSMGGRPRGDRIRRPHAQGTAERAMLWTLDENGKPTALFARTGITDGQYTELMGQKIEEGTQLIAAIVKSSAATASTNPFQQEQPSGGRRPPPGL
ncbi:MAG: efflux RND transporter periplasmic adaptor subunit [Candidatus Eisenbacteria bacterium]|uniref:Efflux RND transporter periplasmic adaptor subunit n=1 Tax=Eiseniibacteriota bacterium TaxID=2212470 RepID=A0A948RYH0_UNCEI|nr:efflux RND transporter periplasmic adaptor subunit [Candidatus Eisenbacteria bacterium]MBU1947906.1 efflux RND transporter periplasmic adaptor subunit [Candidatus Eisenbacteria bacterium]MBU2691904.1 efflux RND transporter periplasmic adaptor subunit [Candidatus Eisenbacteria bacterium]